VELVLCTFKTIYIRIFINIFMTLFVFTTELLILLVLSNYRLADSELNKKEMSRLK